MKKIQKKYHKIPKTKYQKVKKRWYVGFILGKTANKTLEKMNIYFPEIECWYPMEQAIVANKSGYDFKNVPLFENYIFVKLTEGDRITQNKILSQTPIVYFLENEEGFLTDEDILHIRSLSNLCLYQQKECVGKEVEIIVGTYKGYTGICKKTKDSGCHYVIEIDLHGLKKVKKVFKFDEFNVIGETGEIKIYPEYDERSL